MAESMLSFSTIDVNLAKGSAFKPQSKAHAKPRRVMHRVTKLRARLRTRRTMKTPVIIALLAAYQCYAVTPPMLALARRLLPAPVPADIVQNLQPAMALPKGINFSDFVGDKSPHWGHFSQVERIKHFGLWYYNVMDSDKIVATHWYTSSNNQFGPANMHVLTLNGEPVTTHWSPDHGELFTKHNVYYEHNGSWIDKWSNGSLHAYVQNYSPPPHTLLYHHWALPAAWLILASVLLLVYVLVWAQKELAHNEWGGWYIASYISTVIGIGCWFGALGQMHVGEKASSSPCLLPAEIFLGIAILIWLIGTIIWICLEGKDKGNHWYDWKTCVIGAN